MRRGGGTGLDRTVRKTGPLAWCALVVLLMAALSGTASALGDGSRPDRSTPRVPGDDGAVGDEQPRGPEPVILGGAVGKQPTRRYRVREDDTLLSIATRFGTSWCAIMIASRLTDPDTIREGDVLRVPLKPRDCGGEIGVEDVFVEVPQTPVPTQVPSPNTQTNRTRRTPPDASQVSGVVITYYTCIPQGFCGRMANGRNVAPGWAACDVSVMPFGTSFRIVGDPTRTVWTCGDTGAFRGWAVDLWFKSASQGAKYLASVGDLGTIEIIR